MPLHCGSTANNLCVSLSCHSGYVCCWFEPSFKVTVGKKNDKTRRRHFCYPIRKEAVLVSTKILQIALPPVLIIAFHTEVYASNSSLLL